jgi:hypothetical protein
MEVYLSCMFISADFPTYPIFRVDQDRIHNFTYMETPEDVEEFKI